MCILPNSFADTSLRGDNMKSDKSCSIVLQQILGHESIATTESYTHVDDNQLHAAVNANPLAMMFN